MSESPLKEAADLANVAKTVAEAFPDAVQPVSKTFGQAVAPAGAHVGEAICTATGTVRMALAPLRGMIWGWEQIEGIVLPEIGERFKEKLHRLVTPKPTVAGPALEALKFAGGEKVLRDMYVNLLAASMDKETAHKAHPGFVEIIKQITPDEARILRRLATQISVPIVTLVALDNYDSPTPTRFGVHFPTVEAEISCEHLELVSSYLDNLHRLRLAEINTWSTLSDVGYDPMVDDPLGLSEVRGRLKAAGLHTSLEYGSVAMTTWGMLFHRACCQPARPESST